MAYMVTEVCPFCGYEASVEWYPEEEGYEMHCPFCGERIMLCSECPMVDRCDWSEKTGCSMKAHSKLDK